MSRLSLWYPAKPYVVSQKWGIYNPAYEQFGFDKHNGEDFLMEPDHKTHCPIPSVVEETGYNEGAGNFVRLVSQEKWLVDGVECYVGTMFMHHEKILCKKGDLLKTGDVMGIADNTGFSTGPHTHGSYYRLSRPQNLPEYRLDADLHTNQTFDPSPYWNKFYAQDYGLVIGLYAQVVALLKSQLPK